MEKIILGRGQCGSVYRVTSGTTTEIWKNFKLGSELNWVTERTFQEEMKNRPEASRFVSLCLRVEPMRIVYPAKSDMTMDLFDYITQVQRLDVTLTKIITCQLVDALLFLSDVFFYPDIKDENLLFDPQARKILMIDFDLVVPVKKGEYWTKQQKGVVGTLGY